MMTILAVAPPAPSRSLLFSKGIASARIRPASDTATNTSITTLSRSFSMGPHHGNMKQPMNCQTYCCDLMSHSNSQSLQIKSRDHQLYSVDSIQQLSNWPYA